MSNIQQDDADWTVPLRKMIASLRELEARFKNAEQTIRRFVRTSKSAISRPWRASRQSAPAIWEYGSVLQS